MEGSRFSFEKIDMLFLDPAVVFYQDIVTTEQMATQHVQGGQV
jgi:hypothetical protein